MGTFTNSTGTGTLVHVQFVGTGRVPNGQSNCVKCLCMAVIHRISRIFAVGVHLQAYYHFQVGVLKRVVSGGGGLNPIPIKFLSFSILK